MKRLALAQSADIHAKLIKAGVALRHRHGPGSAPTRSVTPTGCEITPADGGAVHPSPPTAVLIATGATPRVLPDAHARRRAHPDLAADSTTCPSCPST